MSLRQLASEFGVSHETVRRVLRSDGSPAALSGISYSPVKQLLTGC